MREPGNRAHKHRRLALLDQLAFELFRATGRRQLMQCIWIYDRDVNLPAISQTYKRLADLAFNRLIEPSPLPLGRPRWVKPDVELAPLCVPDTTLPRSQLISWANRAANEPNDPVHGPAWGMAIQRFDDGSTAVSLVASHLVIDGMGSVKAIAAATNGANVPNFYSKKRARSWLEGCASDAWQILADTPRTMVALANIAIATRKGAAPIKKSVNKPTNNATVLKPDCVQLPTAAVTISAPAWEACAKRLKGQDNTLLLAVVARLAYHMGRCHYSDGTVSLLIPIDTRQGLTDERALAIEFQTIRIEPKGLERGLGSLNAPFKELLRAAKKKQEAPLASLLPAITWLPSRFSATLVNNLFAYGDKLPVSCSNLGRLPLEFGRIDGTPCNCILTRAVDVNVSRSDLERSHGHMVVVASRYDETISLCVEALQLSPKQTTTDDLRMMIERTLIEFGLDAAIET